MICPSKLIAVNGVHFFSVKTNFLKKMSFIDLDQSIGFKMGLKIYKK
jgi:hypothetical protein